MTVEFWFDYGSSYSYLANEVLAKRLAGIAVTYHPFFLRGLEQFSKGVPFSAPKLAYMMRDMQRCADEDEIKLALPPTFPVNGLYALRGALAAKRAGVFERYHTPMFRATWAEQRDTSKKEVVAEVIKELGLSLDIEDPTLKDELRVATETAAKRGAFGAPTFFVGKEMFWGHDRMHQVARAAR